MIQRKDYIDGKVTHEEYYAQFVNDRVKRLVQERFGIEKLKTHFETEMWQPGCINLEKWDNLVGSAMNYVSNSQLKEADEGRSISTYIFILKQAARMVLDDSQRGEV